MILADTSIWVSHLSKGLRVFSDELEAGNIFMHPFIFGELSLGVYRHRSEVLGLLMNLPTLDSAEDSEVISLIEARKLYGEGIGWVDAHLLAAARISGTSLWTLDKALGRVAKSLGVAFS